MKDTDFSILKNIQVKTELLQSKQISKYLNIKETTVRLYGNNLCSKSIRFQAEFGDGVLYRVVAEKYVFVPKTNSCLSG